MRIALFAALCLAVPSFAGCAASSAPAPVTPTPAAPSSEARAPAPAGDAPLSNHVAATAPVPDPGSETDAIRLAVFRYLVQHNASGGQTGVPFVCLEVDGAASHDPSAYILSAMKSGPVRAVPGSACEAGTDGVFLKADHARGRGLVFRTDSVKIEGGKATVTGGYYEAGLSASGNVYTVERQPDGSWRVTKDVMQWIS